MAQALFPPSSDCTAVPGCMTRQSKGWPMNLSPGYVLLLVDSYATRHGIDHACTSSAFATFARRRPDAYGALAFLARQSFVDPLRVAVVGFSAGAWVTLSVAETNSFEPFVAEGNLRFRAAAAFYPPCKQAVGRPGADLHWGARRLDAGGRLRR
jgi:dienelactone hydrolase